MNTFKLHWRFVLAALLVTGALQAHADLIVPPLVFTEYSDTLLTATVAGSPVGTVDLLGPDHWLWRSGLTFSSMPIVGSVRDWEEPGDPTKVNHIDILDPQLPQSDFRTLEFDIHSDVQRPATGGQVAKDGEAGFLIGLTPSLGPNTLHPDIVAIEYLLTPVSFVDKGDEGTNVPDVSRTSWLLGLGLAGIGALRRSLR